MTSVIKVRGNPAVTVLLDYMAVVWPYLWCAHMGSSQTG